VYQVPWLSPTEEAIAMCVTVKGHGEAIELFGFRETRGDFFIPPDATHGHVC
jgi:hypothetical protein